MSLVLLALFGWSSSLAFTPMKDATGQDLALAPGEDGKPYVGFVVLPGNRAGVSAQDTIDATITALAKWRHAADGNLSFDVWKPEDQTKYKARIDQDGVSTIFFVNNMKDPAEELGEDFRAIAYTHVWTDEDGRIVEVDMAINDANYGFLTDPADATYGEGSSRFVLLQDVITHELGHALGLDHTGVMGSTQFTYSWNGQHELGCDDQVGMRALYGDGATGLRGTVRDEAGSAVAGAHVLAVSLDRRTPYGSAVTAADGSYELAGLEEGRYHLIVEPWLAGEGTLTGPELADACGGAGALARTPQLAEDGRAAVWTADGQGLVDTGELIVRCTGDGAAYVEESADGDVLLDGVGVGSRVDVLPAGSERRLELRNIEGDLVVVPMAWSLFSPIRVRMILQDAEGEVVGSLERAPLFKDEATGFRNLDGVLLAEDLPAGDYTLQLVSQGIPAEVVPRGDLYVDPTPYVLITASAGEAFDTEGLLDGSLTRCRSAEEPAPWEGTDAPIPTQGGCSTAATPTSWWAALGLLLPLLARRRQ